MIKTFYVTIYIYFKSSFIVKSDINDRIFLYNKISLRNENSSLMMQKYCINYYFNLNYISQSFKKKKKHFIYYIFIKVIFYIQK